MKKYAKIDIDNLVIQVTPLADDKDPEWLTKRLGGTWVESTEPRKNPAGIGMTYDKTRDAFIAPTPFTSWGLNEDTCQWEAPTPMPEDGKGYSWDEDTVSWVEVPTPVIE